MSREFKMPKRVTIELTEAEERFYRQEYKRLGLEQDIGGWIPGPRETIIKKVLAAADTPQPSDSDKVQAIQVVMDDWPGATSEKILGDLKEILQQGTTDGKE